MSLIPAKPKPSAKEVLPPLLIGALGSVGSVLFYYRVPQAQPIEVPLLILMAGFIAIGYSQGIIRGLGTLVILYLATGLAVGVYRLIAPFVDSVTQVYEVLWRIVEGLFTQEFTLRHDVDFVGRATYQSLALSFAVVTTLVWGGFEAVTRAAFSDTRLPAIGILDNLGGLLVHAVVGILVATLVFNTVGYGFLRYEHNRAVLRPQFNQVLHTYFRLQSFWFPRRPPPIYVYDLDLSAQ